MKGHEEAVAEFQSIVYPIVGGSNYTAFFGSSSPSRLAEGQISSCPSCSSMVNFLFFLFDKTIELTISYGDLAFVIWKIFPVHAIL